MRRPILAGACLTLALAASPAALAAAGSPTDLGSVIDNLTVWLTGLLASLATVFLIIGGARYVMAGGDPIKHEKAKGAISSAVLGYGFALFVPVLVTIIQKIVA